MYAPLGVDSDSSGEETTPPPTPAPSPPPKSQFKFKSLFASTKKLETRVLRRAEELKTGEQKEPLVKKRVRIFAGELLCRQKGSKMEGLTTARGERIVPDPPSPDEIKQEDKGKLEPVGSIEQAAINPMASEVLVLLRQLVAESHPTNKNTDSEPKSDSASQEMNEDFFTNGADRENKVDLPAPEVITVTNRKDGKPIDAKPTQETPALQHIASHLLPPGSARQQHHLIDNYFASFGPPLANNNRLSDTSVNRSCHQQLPHMASPYGCYLQLPCPYPWMTYPPGPQWWPSDHHSTSDEQNAVTKRPPHSTLVNPVILKSCLSPLKTYAQKHDTACNRTLESCKETLLEQSEKKQRNEKVRSAERRLKETIRALENTEREAGDDSDSSDRRSSERKEVRSGQDEPLKETNSTLETQHAGHQGKGDTTIAASNAAKSTAKSTPTPYSTAADDSTDLKTLETYVLEYRQNYSRAVKKYKASENDDERNRMKAIAKETEGKLREAMQAIDTAKRDQGSLANGKGEVKVQRRSGKGKGKGRAIDDVQENRRPTAKKKNLVEKKFNKGKHRVINVELKAEEPRRSKENEGEEQLLPMIPTTQIAHPVQEPAFDVLMDKSVTGNEGKGEPGLPDHVLSDERCSSINHSVIEAAVKLQDEKPIKEPLVEKKLLEVSPPATSPRLYDKSLRKNTINERDKAIEHYKIKNPAVAKALNKASSMHEEKLGKMKEADRVKKEIKALIVDVEANEQASKAKDVSKEAQGPITKQISDKEEAEATAPVPQHEGSAHSKASSPLLSFIETNGAPAALSIADKGRLLAQYKSKYSKFTESIKGDDLAAHEKQLRIKEASELKSMIKSLKIEIGSSQTAVGEEGMEIIKGHGHLPIKEEKKYNIQMEMADTEISLKLFRIKHAKLTKAVKEDAIQDETRQERKAKAERQGLVAQMMESVNKSDSECKGQSAVDEAERNRKNGKDKISSKEQAQILSQGVTLKEVERAIWQAKEKRPTEEMKVNNSTTEKGESRQCPPSDCEIAPSGKEWLSLQEAKSKTPVNNATWSEQASAMGHSAVLSDAKGWVDSVGPAGELTWSKTLVSLAKRTSHKSTINALDISLSPLKPPQMTQDFLNDNFSWKRPPAALTKVTGNSSKTSRQVFSASSDHRSPPLITPFQHNEWVDSDSSPPQVCTFDLPTFSHDYQSDRDQESSPSKYSQSSAYSFPFMDNDSTAKSDRLVS